MSLFGAGILWYVSAIEVISLLVAFILAALAYRGYRKTKSSSLILAAAGFGMLGVASLTEGVLYEVLGYSLDFAHAFRSTLTLAALLLLLLSVYKTR